MILPAPATYFPASLLTDNDPDYSLINSPDRPVSLAQLTVGTLVELVAVRVVRVDLQAVGLGTAGVLGGCEGEEEGGREDYSCDHGGRQAQTEHRLHSNHTNHPPTSTAMLEPPAPALTRP